MFSIICTLIDGTPARHGIRRTSRKAAAFLTAAVLLFSSCTKRTAAVPAKEEDSVKITATFYPLYIMLLNITDGIPGVKLSMIAPANTGCLHDYQLTTKDMKAIESCDILVANGAGMEDFLEKALSLKKDRLIVAAEGYPLVNGNAHVWVSPAGALFEVQKISAGLAALDGTHASLYQKNADAYEAKLTALEKEMHNSLDAFAGTKVITFHEAFPYFAAEFKLDEVATIERDAGTEPSAKELAALIKVIQQAQAGGEKIALFAEPQYPAGAAEIISKETGLTVGELDPAVTGALDKDAYLNAMRQNEAVLKKMLGNEVSIFKVRHDAGIKYNSGATENGGCA